MNDDHNYFVFKLVSGEEIVAVTRIDDTGVEPAFFVNKPLKVELTHKGSNTLVRLVPWITIPEDENYRIGFDKIITMTELEEGHEMIHAYDHYNLTRTHNDTNKVKLSEKMGYMGDVEKTRTMLETIYAAPIGITTTV